MDNAAPITPISKNNIATTSDNKTSPLCAVSQIILCSDKAIDTECCVTGCGIARRCAIVVG